MKSPPATTTTMTTWCHKDVLLMRRPIFWLRLFIEKCATSYKVIYKFWKTSPQLFGFIFWTLKTEEQKFSDKGFATRKETPGRFFNCVWLKIAPLQTESLHLNFEKYWNPSKYFDIQIGSFYFRGFIFYLWKQRAKISDSL